MRVVEIWDDDEEVRRDQASIGVGIDDRNFWGFFFVSPCSLPTLALTA